MATNQQTPCHDEKPNEIRDYGNARGSAPSAIDAAAAEFSAFAGGMIRICSYALRVLGGGRPHV
jgi:hypothetical protein